MATVGVKGLKRNTAQQQHLLYRSKQRLPIDVQSLQCLSDADPGLQESTERIRDL